MYEQFPLIWLQLSEPATKSISILRSQGALLPTDRPNLQLHAQNASVASPGYAETIIISRSDSIFILVSATWQDKDLTFPKFSFCLPIVESTQKMKTSYLRPPYFASQIPGQSNH